MNNKKPIKVFVSPELRPEAYAYFESVNEAAEALCVTPAVIGNCARNPRRLVHGMAVRYAKD